jgi:hypothetical protein
MVCLIVASAISECDVTNCTLTPPTDTVKDVCFVVKNIENLLTEIRERKNVAILQDLTSQKCEGELHGQGGAKWIVIREQLRGHNH